MTKIFFNGITRKSCLAIIVLFIFSGCSLNSSKEQVVQLQRRHIKKLQGQIVDQQKEIQTLKAKAIVAKPIKKDENLALKGLHSLVQSKQWPLALQESSKLLSQYPESMKLRRLRVLIFESMGLREQAKRESLQISRMLGASSQKTRTKIR